MWENIEDMPRHSTVTMRDHPLAPSTRAAAGTLVVHGELFTVETSDRVEIVDLTDKIMAYAREFGIREGTLTLWSLHTTCALFINESQKALSADIRAFLERIVEQDSRYLHNDPAHSDCDRMNADAHLRAMLLGHSLTLQISGGELVLGQWQRILMAELDGPRTRTLRAQVMGVAD
jgi:secondary thiamine-phosphate synthase enzyme